jgi:hypothetical protein
MASTYEKIATTTLGSAATSVTLSSISGSYTDLVLIVSIIGSSGVGITLQYNGDTGSNYSRLNITGNGSAAASLAVSNDDRIFINALGNINSGIAVININNYSNTTTYKTTLSRANTVSTDAVVASVNTWRNTNAITSINISTNVVATYGVGSTFTLYGIKSA